MSGLAGLDQIPDKNVSGLESPPDYRIRISGLDPDYLRLPSTILQILYKFPTGARPPDCSPVARCNNPSHRLLLYFPLIVSICP